VSEVAAKRAAFVILNGGSPTSYQALAHGKPVIGIPGNFDQHLNIDYLQQAGAGLMIRAGQATPERISRAVEKILKCRSIVRRPNAWVNRSRPIRRHGLAKI
jgi:UDP:flavonoid glycosyltransferase YjiC (YdhE family)